MIYLLSIIIIVLAIIASIQWAKLKLWRLEQNLEDWISFGTGDDIVRAKSQRQEYQHYVKICQDNELLKLNIPANVVRLIRMDLAKNDMILPVYFKLLCLKVKGYRF